MLMRPTKNTNAIARRQQQIDRFFAEPEKAGEISSVLAHMLDIPKIVSLILHKKHTPSTFAKLRYALSLIFSDSLEKGAGKIKEALLELGTEKDVIEQCHTLYTYFFDLLKEEGLNDEMDYIKDGFDPAVDELRKKAYHSDDLLVAYQQEVNKHTGITNVKIKYISNQ